MHCLTNLRNFIQQEGVSPLEVEKRKIVAGRLALFLDNWSKVTRNSWVLNTVMEYGIDFLVNPSQHTPKSGCAATGRATPPTTGDTEVALQGRNNRSCREGSRQGFHSRLFLVPRKDGGMRPEINLKNPNEFIGCTP